MNQIASIRRAYSPQVSKPPLGASLAEWKPYWDQQKKERYAELRRQRKILRDRAYRARKAVDRAEKAKADRDAEIRKAALVLAAEMIEGIRAADALVIPRRPTIKKIVSEVANYFCIEEAIILSRRRDDPTARIRQITYYLCKTLTARSLLEIGRRLGRDHTTVLYGIRHIESLMESQPDLKATLEAIRLRIVGVSLGL